MATIQLPLDFKEFLRLLNSYQVEYLLIGGYAVGYHGYPRATGDMDLWVAVHTGGITRSVNWQGGSDFIYCELILYNQAFMHKIKLC